MQENEFIFLSLNGLQAKLTSLRDMILDANCERSVLDEYSSYDDGWHPFCALLINCSHSFETNSKWLSEYIEQHLFWGWIELAQESSNRIIVI